jgi:hypothetical protein
MTCTSGASSDEVVAESACVDVVDVRGVHDVASARANDAERMVRNARAASDIVRGL